ncbi:SpoIIE family protein phosphatase [Desulfobacterales bacterium HSG2]|nr:SpoIIE family protein phosphatase [Desulfobacterales bacterium HSG2]
MAKILVADDDADMRQMLNIHISKAGHTVLLAENGQEAAEVAEQESPQLILIDLQMPVMDGIEAIEQIRRTTDPAKLPIILLSAETDKKKWVESLAAGANDFVLKPYHKSELLARIKTHLAVADLTEGMANMTRKLAKKKRILEDEKKLAGKIQKTILQHDFNFPGIEAEVFYHPSDLIGGDFFDGFQMGDSYVFTIGDVDGYGTSSALIMAAAKGMLRSLGNVGKSPLETVCMFNRMVCDMIGESGLSITLVFAAFNPDKNELEIISAGHNPSFLIKTDETSIIVSSGVPLGLHPDETWGVSNQPFNAGDCLFLYTNGLTELADRDGRQLSENRLIELFQHSRSPKALVEKIINFVKHSGNRSFFDDATMLAIRRT